MRILIPVVAILIGVLFAMAILLQPRPDTAGDKAAPTDQTPQTPTTSDAGDSPASPTPAQQSPSSPQTQPAQAPADTSSQPPTAQPATRAGDLQPFEGLKALAPTTRDDVFLGSNADGSQFKVLVKLSHYGPGIALVRLTDYFTKPGGDVNYMLHETAQAGAGERAVLAYPFQARFVTINGQRLDIGYASWALTDKHVRDEQKVWATYELHIVDGQDQPVLDIQRRFDLEADSYELKMTQRFVNRAGRPLQIIWEQFGQTDATDEGSSYRGDDRTVMSGFFDTQRDPTKTYVYTNDKALSRKDVMPKPMFGPTRLFWPPKENAADRELVWLACLNRYFVVALRATTAGADQDPAITTFDSLYQSVAVLAIGDKGDRRNIDQRKILITLTSKPIDLQAGQTSELDLALFTGPRDRALFKVEPYKSLWFKRMIVYTMGCTWCTFQPLAKGLLGLLRGLHSVVQDWGVAIILLVCFVRLLLHPITKRAQVNMGKMGKQMGALAPEIEKIKKKYENDQKKIGAETMKLYRERGINPANMLGCLPMFLQMPIWIALYAMLYLAIELRHQSAFYGVFQWISAGHWAFLKDLSAPDRFITFLAEPKTFNLLFMPFDYSSLNILPLLMAVVFFIQQKLTMTPAATEEQRRQQKIMGYMVFVFPVFMYSMPSGLTLYIMASTGIGIIESYLVRKHIREQEEAGTLFEKKPLKPTKPGGLRDRMQQAMDAAQQQRASRRDDFKGGDKGGVPYKKRKGK